MKTINENKSSVIKEYCYENHEIDEIPNMRERRAKNFHKTFPMKFKIKTVGEFQVSDNGVNKTLRTNLWSINFDESGGDRILYSLEFEEGIKVQKCNTVTFEFYDLNANEFNCHCEFL